MAEAMEILPRVHSIPVGEGAFMGVYVPNVYLVLGEKAALIDSGYEADDQVKPRLDYLKAMGCQPAYIFITHSGIDHFGGAAKIKKATGAQVLMHSRDVAQGAPVDVAVEGGEVVSLGKGEIEVIHTPGHTPGHICLLLREEGVLFSGDHILGMGTTAISPKGGDMAQYMASLKKLLNYPLKLICPGHGPVVRNPRAKLQELYQHRQERELQVLVCLKAGKRQISEVVREIYPELEPRLVEMARGQVQAHLIKLEREGRVVAREKEYSLG